MNRAALPTILILFLLCSSVALATAGASVNGLKDLSFASHLKEVQVTSGGFTVVTPPLFTMKAMMGAYGYPQGFSKRWYKQDVTLSVTFVGKTKFCVGSTGCTATFDVIWRPKGKTAGRIGLVPSGKTVPDGGFLWFKKVYWYDLKESGEAFRPAFEVPERFGVAVSKRADDSYCVATPLWDTKGTRERETYHTIHTNDACAKVPMNDPGANNDGFKLTRVVSGAAASRTFTVKNVEFRTQDGGVDGSGEVDWSIRRDDWAESSPGDDVDWSGRGSDWSETTPAGDVNWPVVTLTDEKGFTRQADAFVINGETSLLDLIDTHVEQPIGDDYVVVSQKGDLAFNRRNTGVKTPVWLPGVEKLTFEPSEDGKRLTCGNGYVEGGTLTAETVDGVTLESNTVTVTPKLASMGDDGADIALLEFSEGGKNVQVQFACETPVLSETIASPEAPIASTALDCDDTRLDGWEPKITGGDCDDGSAGSEGATGASGSGGTTTTDGSTTTLPDADWSESMIITKESEVVEEGGEKIIRVNDNLVLAIPAAPTACHGLLIREQEYPRGCIGFDGDFADWGGKIVVEEAVFGGEGTRFYRFNTEGVTSAELFLSDKHTLITPTHVTTKPPATGRDDKPIITIMEKQAGSEAWDFCIETEDLLYLEVIGESAQHIHSANFESVLPIILCTRVFPFDGSDGDKGYAIILFHNIGIIYYATDDVKWDFASGTLDDGEYKYFEYIQFDVPIDHPAQLYRQNTIQFGRARFASFDGDRISNECRTINNYKEQATASVFTPPESFGSDPIRDYIREHDCTQVSEETEIVPDPEPVTVTPALAKPAPFESEAPSILNSDFPVGMFVKDAAIESELAKIDTTPFYKPGHSYEFLDLYNTLKAAGVPATDDHSMRFARWIAESDEFTLLSLPDCEYAASAYAAYALRDRVDRLRTRMGEISTLLAVDASQGNTALPPEKRTVIKDRFVPLLLPVEREIDDLSAELVQNVCLRFGFENTARQTVRLVSKKPDSPDLPTKDEAFERFNTLSRNIRLVAEYQAPPEERRAGSCCPITAGIVQSAAARLCETNYRNEKHRGLQDGVEVADLDACEHATQVQGQCRWCQYGCDLEKLDCA